MSISFNVKVKDSCLVDKNLIIELYEYLDGIYDHIEISMSRFDGGTRKTMKLTDVIEFDNVARKRLRGIRIVANSGYQEEVEVEFYANLGIQEVEVDVRSGDEDKAEKIRNSITDKLEKSRFENPHNLISKWGYNLPLVVGTILSIVFVGMIGDYNKSSDKFYLLFIQVFATAIFTLFLTVLSKIAFPRVFISLGASEKKLLQIRSWRNFVLIVLLCGTIVSVAGSYVFGFLQKLPNPK